MLKKAYSKTKPVCKVTFSLPLEAAPNAEKVLLLGDFNDWNAHQGAEMKKTKSHFEASLELAAGRTYEFRYLIDGKLWENDWDADGYIPSLFAGITNSIIVLDAVTIEAPVESTPKAATAPKAEPKATAQPVKKAEPKAKAKPTQAAKPAQPARVVKDDLTKIEGIGPKIAEIIIAKGIATYADLAKAKPAALKTILDEAGSRFKMHDPATWPAQAKLAAAGAWEQLSTMQDELKGGKK